MEAMRSCLLKGTAAGAAVMGSSAAVEAARTLTTTLWRDSDTARGATLRSAARSDDAEEEEEEEQEDEDARALIALGAPREEGDAA